MAKALRIIFMNGESMEFSDSSCAWAIDEKTRIVYVARAKSLLRIPFETVKMIEEARADEP